MSLIDFEWDEKKALSNFKKHKISFELFLQEKQILMKYPLMEVDKMRDHYDFSNAVKNPNINKLKKQITIRLDTDTIDYFKDLSDETGIKYQQLINLYLAECARKHLKPKIEWSKQ